VKPQTIFAIAPFVLTSLIAATSSRATADTRLVVELKPILAEFAPMRGSIEIYQGDGHLNAFAGIEKVPTGTYSIDFTEGLCDPEFARRAARSDFVRFDQTLSNGFELTYAGSWAPVKATLDVASLKSLEGKVGVLSNAKHVAVACGMAWYHSNGES
jgi:hypothetical protein